MDRSVTDAPRILLQPVIWIPSAPGLLTTGFSPVPAESVTGHERPKSRQNQRWWKTLITVPTNTTGGAILSALPGGAVDLMKRLGPFLTPLCQTRPFQTVSGHPTPAHLPRADPPGQGVWPGTWTPGAGSLSGSSILVLACKMPAHPDPSCDDQR